MCVFQQKLFGVILALVILLEQRISIVTSFECPDSQCADSPCSCDEPNLLCRSNTCHNSPGCDQCIDGYFKQSYSHRCVQCQEVAGEGCSHCTDYSGCQQCNTGYEMMTDTSCVDGFTLKYCDSPGGAVTCDISNSWIRLLFSGSTFDEGSNNWCYDYVLYLRSHLDGEIDSDCEIEYLSDVSQVSLEFVDLENDLDTYLDLSSSVLGDYAIEDNVLMITPSATDGTGYEYSVCVDSSVIGHTGSLAVVNSNYLLTAVSGTGDTTSGSVVVPDLEDTSGVGEVPVSINEVPLPGVSIDLIDYDVNGTGTFTIASNTQVVRGWWIESCSTDDDGMMTVEFLNEYFDFDRSDASGYQQLCNGLRDSPMLMPPYDRWAPVLPDGCGTLQGIVESCDNRDETLTVTIDTIVNPVVFFEAAEFVIDRVDFIILGNELNVDDDTAALCLNLDTNEQTDITSVEDFESYVSTINDSQSIVCYSQSHTSIHNAIIDSESSQTVEFTADTDGATVNITFIKSNESNTTDTFSLAEFVSSIDFDTDSNSLVKSTTAARPAIVESICDKIVNWDGPDASDPVSICRWSLEVRYCIQVGVTLNLESDGTKITAINEMSTKVDFDYDAQGTVFCSDPSIDALQELGTTVFEENSIVMSTFAAVTIQYVAFVELQLHSSIGDFSVTHNHFTSGYLSYETGFTSISGGSAHATLFSFAPVTFETGIDEAIKVNWDKNGVTCPANDAGKIIFSILPSVMWGIQKNYDTVMQAKIDHTFFAESTFPAKSRHNCDRVDEPVCFVNANNKKRIQIGVDKNITYELSFYVSVPQNLLVAIEQDTVYQSNANTYDGPETTYCQKGQASTYGDDCCDETLYPTSQPTPNCLNSVCESSPCGCDEPDLHCMVQCHVNGCDQCDYGYWKPDFNHKCLPCDDETVGEGCLHCTDFIGCVQCTADVEGISRKGHTDCLSGMQDANPTIYFCESER